MVGQKTVRFSLVIKITVFAEDFWGQLKQYDRSVMKVFLISTQAPLRLLSQNMAGIADLQHKSLYAFGDISYT